MGNSTSPTCNIPNRSTSFDSYTSSKIRNTSSNNNRNSSSSILLGSQRRKRPSGNSNNGEGDYDFDYGWFEDFESPGLQKVISNDQLLLPLSNEQSLHRALSLQQQPASEPPLYILESSLETQQLWYNTAGKRPRQPDNEREYFEKLWSLNFQQSNVPCLKEIVSSSNCLNESCSDKETTASIATERVEYEDKSTPTKSIQESDALTQAEREAQQLRNIDLAALKRRLRNHDIIPRAEINGEIVFRGKSPFSNAVSKSFPQSGGGADHGITSMTLHMPYYRIVAANTPKIEDSAQNSLSGNASMYNLQSLHSLMTAGAAGSYHAEYLIVVTLGNISSITFGIWKRHSDFQALASILQAIDDNNFNFNVQAQHSKSSKSSEKHAQSSSAKHKIIDGCKQYKNSLLSWQCVMQRKRWFKSLDREYLALKCFLLERFMQDVLFESQNACLLARFFGLIKEHSGSSCGSSAANSASTSYANISNKENLGDGNTARAVGGETRKQEQKPLHRKINSI